MIKEEKMQADVPRHVMSEASDTGPAEYLVFKLGNEEYAIDILCVREIRGYESVTRIANTPEFIKGVINLRGVIVPIVDLRIKFGHPHSYDAFTVVIILNVHDRLLGIVVDGVSDVIALSQDQIRPAPQFSASFDTRYILGMAAQDERMLIVSDIAKLMSAQDMALMDVASA